MLRLVCAPSLQVTPFGMNAEFLKKGNLTADRPIH